MEAIQAIMSGMAFGAGELGNIIQGSKENSYQNKILSLLNNPAALAQLASKLQQPLNSGLTQNVTNQVQGNLAERGLSQAPGIFAASESQALAPYYQQNQNTALQSVLQLLGMPASTFKNPVNNSGALSLFLKALQPQGSAGYNPPQGGFTYTPTTFDSGIPFLPTDTSVPDFNTTFSGVSSDSGN